MLEWLQYVRNEIVLKNALDRRFSSLSIVMDVDEAELESRISSIPT